ncbi:MFS transporter [Compostimonas suwonensis]|uniref:Putative MFS family arabinose efflux permease n=1 Tax=Compostimonas suwonensis TaxID=1048394 RepID=A0A2M9BWI4_9MICO|nr:MFS transporter [Compostimonas suwonensis]PJJ62312.1 putative MFS family arabinose efflux permease [Compostimonas suwonensis]
MTAAPRTPFGWRFTAPLLLGSALNPINSSMIATGLVGIGVDFHTGPGTTASLISVLYLCSAIMQPTMGKLSTLFGPRRVFLAGIVILFVGGVVGAAAPAFGFLLVSRALIGIGTSAAYPTAMAIVRRRADEAGIGVPSRVLGNFSIAAQVTVVFGLPIGGVLAGAFGWRALFFVNIPFAVVAFVLTLIGVAKDGPLSRERTKGGLLSAIDVPGILLFAGTVTTLLVFLSDLSSPLWWLLPVVVALGAGLFLWERRAASPLIDFRMLGRNRPLQRTYLRQALVGLGVYTALYGASQWMEQSAHLSASAVGLILLPLSGLSIVISRVVSGRGWIRWPLILAGAALILTAGVMLLITAGSSVLVLIGMSLLFGFANGFSGFANQAALYGQTSADDIAVASGLYRTVSYIGAIFSASLISITFGQAATDSGFHTLAWVIGGIGAAVLLLTVFDRSVPRTAAR